MSKGYGRILETVKVKNEIDLFDNA